MLKVTRDLALATTITGSLPRPRWYTANLAGRPFRVALADALFREQYFDAVSSFIRDQERAGLDILTDGDCRFDTDVGGMAWFAYPAQRFIGLEGYEPYRGRRGYGGSGKGQILFEVMESRVLPRAVAKVTRGPLDYTPLWKVAQEMTRRPVKFGTITAELIGLSVGNSYYASRRELILDLSSALREELLELARAGCPIIQMEEPSVHLADVRRHADVEAFDADFFVEVFNRTVSGLGDMTEVWCHTCWGNPAQQRLFATPRSYAASLPYLNRLKADVITFETASTNGTDFEVIGKEIPDKKVAIGVVDHRNLQVERPEEVAALIRKALKYIPPERLVVSSDCGFGREGMSRRIAFFKMVAIVQGTNIVRRELGLPEADCPAADPRFSVAEED